MTSFSWLPDTIKPRHNAPLGQQTWFQTGGNAECLVQPNSIELLQHLLAAKPAKVDLHVIGAGSNTLIRDGGLPGVTIRLRRGFADIVVDGDTIIVGAGALDSAVANAAADAGIGGLEFLSGIPGTLGGNIVMNAGCYGREINDVLVWAEAVTNDGKLVRLSNEEFGFQYRYSDLPAGWIITRACLKGEPAKPATIRQTLAEIKHNRETAQPTGGRTGGSTFRNPDGHKAWQLIDNIGFRGKQLGGAMFSEKHCNFLINTGTATAADLEALGEQARAAVQQQTNIDLHWEIQRVGLNT